MKFASTLCKKMLLFLLLIKTLTMTRYNFIFNYSFYILILWKTVRVKSILFCRSSQTTNGEKADLIQDIMMWQKRSDVLNNMGCFILNFGYKETSSFPLIPQLAPYKSALPLDVKPKCSLLVGPFSLVS